MATTTTTTTPAHAATPRRYETLAEASERTGISARTLRRRIADGSLPAYRNGCRILRVSPGEVDQLLEAFKQGRDIIFVQPGRRFIKYEDLARRLAIEVAAELDPLYFTA